MDRLGELGNQQDPNGASYKMRSRMEPATVILIVAVLVLGGASPTAIEKFVARTDGIRKTTSRSLEGSLRSRAIDGAQGESTDGGT